MNEVVISGLEDKAIQRLQRRAVANGRSLEDEIKHLLTWGVDYIEQVQALTRTMKPMKSVVPKDVNSLQFNPAAHRAKIEQMLQEASARDAKLLEELDQLLGDSNQTTKGRDA